MTEERPPQPGGILKKAERLLRIVVMAQVILSGARGARAHEHMGPHEDAERVDVALQQLAQKDKPALIKNLPTDVIQSAERLLKQAEDVTKKDLADVRIANLQNTAAQVTIRTPYGDVGIGASLDDSGKSQSEVVFTPTDAPTFFGLTPGLRVAMNSEGQRSFSMTVFGVTEGNSGFDWELKDWGTVEKGVTVGIDNRTLCVAPRFNLGQFGNFGAVFSISKDGRTAFLINWQP